MSTHLSFKAGAREQRAERITFDVDGGARGKETFSLVEHPSVLYLLSIGSLGQLDIDSPDPHEVAAAMGSIWDFFAAVLEQDDWRRFRRFSIRAGLDIRDLMGILQGLVPELMGRPTQRPSDSLPSSLPNGSSLTDASPLQAATVPVT